MPRLGRAATASVHEGMEGSQRIVESGLPLPERDNICAALTWALKAGHIDDGLRLAGGLTFWWTSVAFRYGEGRHGLTELTAAAGDDADRRWLAVAYATGAALSYRLFDLGSAWPAADKALLMARESGDSRLRSPA